MGLFGALNTSVNGLQSQSYAIQNISGNIANSQTIAYKGINTSFVDLIPDAPASQQIAGGVIAFSQATNNVQGAIQNSAVSTYMAINGDGYFAVKQPSGSTGTGAPVLTGTDYYTRRGDFQMNQFGYLVNGAGYYLEGIPIDARTGNPIGNALAPLQFNNAFLPATPTTTITYGANLPSYPQTTSSNSAFPGTELLKASDFLGADPTVGGTGTVVGSDVTTFLKESLDGGSVTAYDSSGQPANTQLRWAKVAAANIPAKNAVLTGTAAVGTIDASGGNITFDINGKTVTLSSTFPGTGGVGKYSLSELESAINGTSGITVNATDDGAGHLILKSTGTAGASDTVTLDNFTGPGTPDASLLGYSAAPTLTANGADPTTGIDTWELFYQVNSGATGTQVAWKNAGVDFKFDSSGNLDPPITTVALSGVMVNGTHLGNIALQLNGLTQFSSSSGSVTVTSLNQDGYPPGQLQAVSINKNGRIQGSFTNGKNVDLALIPLMSFASPNNLKALDGGAFSVTGDSGPALTGASGQLVGGALEGSNADIADQFTKLIVTQQAYAANTKVITTVNQMSQDMLSMLR
jgi:flagellar hook protein FlgE